MPRRQRNNQTKQSTAVLTTAGFVAKCTGCQLVCELKACEYCQFPECTACIEKHREADKLSQRKVIFKTKVDTLRQQTVLKIEALQQSIETMTTSVDLLKTTYDIFERVLVTEYNVHEQKLEQSQTINKQHIEDLGRMWIEFEKNSTSSVEECAQTTHLVDQIEVCLRKEYIQLCFQPNTLLLSLGSLNETSPDSILPTNIVRSKEKLTDASVPVLSCVAEKTIQSPNVDDFPPTISVVEANKFNSIVNVNATNSDIVSVSVVTKDEQQPPEHRRRRRNRRRHHFDNANKPPTSSEPKFLTAPVTELNILTTQTTSVEISKSIELPKKVVTSLNFNRLKMKPRTSMSVVGGQRMAFNDEYVLVCPKNKLCLLDAHGKVHLSIERDFDVSDMCWSTYLKKFLILSDNDLYSLDLAEKPSLTIEISEFACNMDEFTCYNNIFIVISDFGGSDIEVWDMKMKWTLITRYEQPISCREGQGICSIRFSSSGSYLGVTLTEPFRGKAYFQLRYWQDMKVLRTVEQPFYEGYCNHYMLALPNDEFLVYKYSERKMFFFDSSGQQKQTIQYVKGISSTALISNDENCLIIQTSRPDELHFYDL